MIEIQQQSLFDYDSLDEPTRLFVQEKAQSIHTRLKRTAEDIIAIGEDLIEVKARLGHGQFVGWVETEFDLTRQSAANFMRVAERFGQIECKTVLHLPIRVLYELASPSTPDAVIEMVDTGQIPATIPAIREAKQEMVATNLVSSPALTEHEASLAGYRGYDNWQEAQKWEDKIQIDKPLAPNLGVVEEKSEMRIEAPVKSPALTALQSSESTEWYTPAEYVEAARELMGAIDIDPASCEEANHIVKATKYYTKQDNGLHQSWHGRVWLNPPYGFDGGVSNQELWSRTLIERYRAGLTTEAVLLVNAVTGNKWFQPLWDYLICFTDHRIRFYNTEIEIGAPTHSNALIYFGSQHKRFIELFSRFGRVIREAKADEY